MDVSLPRQWGPLSENTSFARRHQVFLGLTGLTMCILFLGEHGL